MSNRRPIHVIGALVAVAVASVTGSGLLDQHADWGEPRQAAANVLWIVFLLSVLTLIVVGIRMLFRHRRAAVR